MIDAYRICVLRRWCHGVPFDPCHQLIMGRRPVHSEALRIIASPPAQQCERFLVLHAFGNGFEMKRPGKVQDDPYDLLAVCVMCETLDEGFVYLERIYRQFQPARASADTLLIAEEKDMTKGDREVHS